MTQTINAAARLATEADRSAGMATQLAAFIADPLIRWMFPRPDQYFTFFPELGRHFAGGAFDHGTAYCTDDFAGSALWLPPGVLPDEEALGAVLAEGIAAPRQEEVFALMEQVGASHPEVEHWYLPAIGVDPAAQGRGIGSALLSRSLETIDRLHQAAYLESSNPRNIPLYERFGFEVMGKIQFGSSPVVTPMFRAAR